LRLFACETVTLAETGFFSHGPGAANPSDGVYHAYSYYRQPASKLAGIPLIGVVEIIHMPFVTPTAQRYLHLGNTLEKYFTAQMTEPSRRILRARVNILFTDLAQ
jgi:hypothetical protein